MTKPSFDQILNKQNGNQSAEPPVTGGKPAFTTEAVGRGTGLEPVGNIACRPRRRLPPPLGAAGLACAVLPWYCPRPDGNDSRSMGRLGILQPQNDVVAVGGRDNGGEERTIQIHSQPHLSFDGLGLLRHRPNVRLPAGPPPVSPCVPGFEPSGCAGGALPRRSVRGSIYRIQETSAAVALGMLGGELLVRGPLDPFAYLGQSPHYVVDFVFVPFHRYVVPSNFTADCDFQR